MVWMVNYTSRAFNVGGTVMPPFIPKELDDSYKEHPDIVTLMESDSDNKGEDGNYLKCFAEVPPPDTGAPVELPTVRDVPYVSQTGETLNCTMGNWNGEPTEYHYAWEIDDTPIDNDNMNYTIAAGDVGKTAHCIVTAVNAAGSTEAPPSNDVVVTDPVVRIRNN